MKKISWFLTAVMILMTASIGLASARSAEDQGRLQTLIEQAQQNGSTVVVIGVPAGQAEPAGDEISGAAAYEQRAIEARKNFRAIIEESPMVIERVHAAVGRADADGSIQWPIWATGLALIYLLIGYGVEYMFRGWSRPHFAYFCKEHPDTRSEKIAYLLFRAVMQAMALLMQAAVAAVLVISFDDGAEHIRTVQFFVIAAVFGFRLSATFFQNMLSVDTAAHRLLPIDDEQASRIYRTSLVLFAVLAVIIGINVWTSTLGIDKRSAQFLAIFFTFIAMLGEITVVVLRRADVTPIILGTGPVELKWKPRIFLAKTWHVMFVVYFVASFAVTASRVALEQPNAMGLTNMPVLAIFSGVALYGVALLVIEWIFERRHKNSGISDPASLAEGDAPLMPQKSYQSLIEKSAAILVMATMVWWVFKVWGMDLTEPGSVLNNLWEVLLILFLSYMAYESVKIGIDRKIEEEGDAEEPEPGEEGGAVGASRLATLLPLFRNFLLIVIATISGMIVLSELGVDIAPLFAGAGVIGLAIGFGAQTLIRDIFSGAFFLMDDAFRKGEYIDIGSVKGTVEKISIRSMQLRHHLGPLNTVPFGEIQRLTNYSRDWVMMKLPLRLTYDTDVEKVRKLIKNLGQELLEHPEVGEKFLQPLKSQGVFKMEDSAMIIRVKFMTKPGEQFVARKLVYSRIRELFEENDIKFAHREVTVRVADDTHDKRLTEAEKKAIGGAVNPALDPEPQT